MPILALTVITCLSGYFVRFTQSWDLLYKCNLFVHPLAGVLWAVVLSRSLRGKGMGFGSRRQIPVYSLLLLLLSGGVVASTFTGSISWLLLAMGIGAPLVLAATVRKRGRRAFRFPAVYETFRLFFFFILLLVSASGVLILTLHMGHKLRPVFEIHAMAGTGLLGLFAAMVFVGRNRASDGVREVLEATVGVQGFYLKREAAVLLSVGLLCILVGVTDQKEKDVEYVLHLSTTPLEKRRPQEADIIPADFPYASLMASVDTCGSAEGCHAGIVEDHRRSSHNRSIQTSYFQTNLNFMTDEIGGRNTYICAGCHFPNAYFLAGTDFRYYADRDGYSCLYCHTVDQVQFTEEKGKTVLTLKPNVNHLKMFAPRGPKTDQLDPLNVLMIQLNPQGHARVFRKDLYFRDEYCQACHNLQIKPSENPGFMKANCINCHMQPRKWMGEVGLARNHFFPGTNLAGPADLGDGKALRINTKYSRGELELALRGWGGIWSLVPKEERKIKDIWLQVSVEPLVDPEPGKPFAYRVVTTNTSLDHAFPAAPLDLIEVWLETWVRDSEGRILFQSGVLDEHHMIPPETHKLGGYMIGMDDHLVTKNRVWQIKKKVIEREIKVNHQVKDRFAFIMPEDVSTGPLEIYASWNYRKLNQEFVNWAYGGNGMTVPVLHVAEVRHQVDMGTLEEPPRHLADVGYPPRQ